jgi:hypothetical protein
LDKTVTLYRETDEPRLSSLFGKVINAFDSAAPPGDVLSVEDAADDLKEEITQITTGW